MPQNATKTFEKLTKKLSVFNALRYFFNLQLSNSREKGIENWFENSPHSGRNPKANIVQQWRLENPEGRKIECHRDTGLSRVTIDKWWESM